MTTTSTLTPLQEDILKHLCNYRCATYTHLYRYVCQDHTDIYHAVETLIQWNYLEKDQLKEEEEEIYFLTKDGLALAKPLLAQTQPDQPVTHRNAKQLRIHPRFYAHYVATLDFVLEAKANLQAKQIPHRVKLWGFSMDYEPVCPDAVIEVGNTHFLIEIDRMTETLERLKQKMDYYSRLCINRQKKTLADQLPHLMVLFVYEGTPSLAQLTKLYEAAGDVAIQNFWGREDFVVGSHKETLSLFMKELVPEAFGQVAPYREQLLRVFEEGLAHSALTPKDGLPTQQKQGRGFDYEWVKETPSGRIVHTLFVDLSVLRFSRLSMLGFLSQAMKVYRRSGCLREEGQVFLILDDRKFALTQHLLRVIGFEPVEDVQLVTKSGLVRQLLPS